MNEFLDGGGHSALSTSNHSGTRGSIISEDVSVLLGLNSASSTELVAGEI